MEIRYYQESDGTWTAQYGKLKLGEFETEQEARDEAPGFFIEE